MSALGELRRAARSSLKGKWQVAIIITILSAVIGVYSLGPLPNVAVDIQDWIKDPSLLNNWSEAFYFDIRSVRQGLFFLLGAAGVLGQCYCYTRLARREECRIVDLFHCYPQMLGAIGLRLLRWLYTVLGLSVFIVPGIYLRYVYCMAPWIMAEHPEKGAIAALQQSKRMMDGQKLRLLKLDLSFAGWFALSLLSLGIGLLFLIPYHSAARAEFYMELTSLPSKGGKRGEKTQVMKLKRMI